MLPLLLTFALIEETTREKSVTFLSGIAGYRFRQSRKSLRDFSEKGLRDIFAVL